MAEKRYTVGVQRPSGAFKPMFTGNEAEIKDVARLLCDKHGRQEKEIIFIDNSNDNIVKLEF